LRSTITWAVEGGLLLCGGCLNDVHPGYLRAGSAGKKKSDVKVIPLARANNVSIMLTQFSTFKRGVQGIRQAVYSGKGLGIEKLGLLLQVKSRACKSPLIRISCRSAESALSLLSVIYK